MELINSHRISWVKSTLAVHGYAAWDGSPTRHPHSRTYLKVTTGLKMRARLYAVHAYRRHSVITMLAIRVNPPLLWAT